MLGMRVHTRQGQHPPSCHHSKGRRRGCMRLAQYATSMLQAGLQTLVKSSRQPLLRKPAKTAASVQYPRNNPTPHLPM